MEKDLISHISKFVSLSGYFIIGFIVSSMLLKIWAMKENSKKNKIQEKQEKGKGCCCG